MRVCVIGTGYVGLVTGVGLAGAGHQVTCLDMRQGIVDALSAGEPPIFEEGLAEALDDALRAGRIRFSLPSVEVVADSDLVLIAVGTPSKDGDIDLGQIRQAAELAGQAVRIAASPLTVVVKSTVVPGTTRDLVGRTIEKVSGRSLSEYGLGMNPEFLREGSALADFRRPDRIVVGYENGLALEMLRELYADFDCLKIEVNTQTAELIKYANNMLLALQISAANEIADVAATLGDVDPLDVMSGVLADHRWAGDSRTPPPIAKYLVPGCGFGGSCFPKDVEALREFGRARGVPMHISGGALDVNAEQPSLSLAGMLGDDDLAGRSVLVLGLAFKPDTDDIRETPALPIVRELRDRGGVVSAHDPLAVQNFAAVESTGISFVEDWRSSVEAADVVVVVTPWREYRALPEAVRPGTTVLDPRRSLIADEFPRGVTYRSIGVHVG